jgi:hypothetical protein
VIGTWQFHDRSGAVVPANTFLVELLSKTDTPLAWAYTNANGSFFLGPLSFPAEPVKVRIWTYVNYAGGSTLMVVHQGGTGLADAYLWDTDVYTPTYNPPPYVPNYIFSVGVQTVPVPTPAHQNPKAWWLQDDLRRGFLFLPDRSGSFTIEWPHSEGTQCRGNHILLEKDSADSPDEVQHEMGHAVMFNVYAGYWPIPPCPPEHFIGVASNSACAWTEGWADFWPLAVNNDPFFQWHDGTWEYLEDPFQLPPFQDGDQVEGRVAGALWDLIDTPNDGYDTYDGDFNDVWEVFTTQPCDITADFVTVWENLYGPRTTRTHEGVRCLYQNTINYNAAPAFGGLPDVTLNMNGSRDNAIDLWAYTIDEESSNDRLSYAFSPVPVIWCGVSIDGGRYVDVFPRANWAGSCAVGIAASDTLAATQDSFQVTVVDNMPPSPPGNLRSLTSSGGWTPAAVTMAWNHATDVGGGVDGYSFAWDTCAPDRAKDAEETTTHLHSQVSVSGLHNFAVRAVDYGGNWGNPTCVQVNVDADRPSSSVAPLPGEQTRNWWMVAWSGSDAHSGVAHYDVQYQVEPDGAWTDWRVDTATTQGLFVHAIPGQFYAFRCRAVDHVGNVEAWPTFGEAEVSDAGTLAGADTSGLSESYLPLVERDH